MTVTITMSERETAIYDAGTSEWDTLRRELHAASRKVSERSGEDVEIQTADGVVYDHLSHAWLCPCCAACTGNCERHGAATEDEAMTTIKSLTEQQIRSLRSEAYEHGDARMGAICDLAIDGKIDTDDYTVLSRDDMRVLGDMSRDDAYAAIVATINDAEAQS